MKALEWLHKKRETNDMDTRTPGIRKAHNTTNMSGLYPGRGNETASASAAPQVSRESAAATSPGPMRVMGHIREAAAAPAGAAPGLADAPGRRFRVVLLQEGMGNLEDCYYYTRSAIESCPPLFEGKKLFVDHPDAMEEQTRPERSVRDVAGWFENLGVEDASDGRALLVGDAVLLESPDVDSIKALMLESIAYSKTHGGSDLVGLSISAGGDFETVSLEQFSRTESIPEGCQAKLAEASAKGISMIRPVRRMTSATSCDLVTEAGAGGRISQLLERERMAKQIKEAKEGDKKEDGAGAPAKDGSADGKAGGAKSAADKDKDTIQSMLKKHVGDGFTDEDNAMASEAYQAALEAHEGDEKEAMETAGRVMKMAKHAKQKQAKQAAEEAAKQEAAGGKQQQADGPTAEAVEAGGEKTGFTPGGSTASAGSIPKDQTTVEAAKTIESAVGARKELEAKVLTLTGENAALKAKLDDRDLEDFIDGKLRESRLPRDVTRKFRESIKGIKTQKEVTEKLALFQEGWLAGGGEADGMSFVIQPEKGVTEAAVGKFSAADCLDA